MLQPDENLLCRYSYDPLDRLAGCMPSAPLATLCFYLKSRLATEIDNAAQRSIMQYENTLLMQHHYTRGAVQTALLVTDRQNTLLNALQASVQHAFAYTPYGYCKARHISLNLPGFNGERLDPVTGHYLLGNGHRTFNPTLMRFNSPDRLSPFGKGGLNAFSYCKGDPINFSDPSGKFFQAIINALKSIQTGLSTGWDVYSVVFASSQLGVRRVATLTSKTGYAVSAVGIGLQSSGYAVGATISSAGSGIVAAGEVLKISHKVVTAVKSGKLASNLSQRAKQIRSFFPLGRPAVAETEPVSAGAVRDPELV